jgi:prephenate dehydrogenase
MEGDGFKDLAQARVAVVGLGLMGGSLALALRGKCAELVGIDPDPAARSLARERDVVDRASGDPADLLPGADLVVLAAPVQAILRLLEGLPAWHPGAAVVFDLGSTKRQIVRAMAALPGRFDPLGGHPMCGSEKSGLAHARADLYLEAPFALCALERTSARALALGAALAQAVGARPLWLDPVTHDRWAAATSHLPYLVACALALSAPPEARPLVGPGFTGASRLAAASPTVMLDILQTNPDEALQALIRFQAQLARLEAALRGGDWQALQAQMQGAAAAHQQVVS